MRALLSLSLLLFGEIAKAEPMSPAVPAPRNLCTFACSCSKLKCTYADGSVAEISVKGAASADFIADCMADPTSTYAGQSIFKGACFLASQDKPVRVTGGSCLTSTCDKVCVSYPPGTPGTGNYRVTCKTGSYTWTSGFDTTSPKCACELYERLQGCPGTCEAVEIPAIRSPAGSTERR